MTRKIDADSDRLDDAARAGWLYYIAGNTQDEIAKKLGVSRQTAQRLVSLAVSEKLIKVRLDHPIGRCIELSGRLKQVYGLIMCEVAPADPASTSDTLGVAEAAAAELERYLVSQHPVICAMGTGRMLRAMVEQVSPMDCPQHKMVSLVGNIAPDGSASLFDVVSRIGDRVKAPHYPMPLPVIAPTVHEKTLLLSQKTLRNVIELARQADVTFIGIGTVDETAALLRDGFVRHDEIRALMRAGAVGEITGWAFDAQGALIEGLTNDRVLSVPLDQPAQKKVIGVAMATPRLRAVKGAIRGKLINGLITNETMAELLLET
ncbi:MAG: sugar-binding transcriptional regulator [Aestuariivirga sp.]|uniref:sugar-binding transcriptional regulator n=1 Tax=Aestuariivirga sp. TaxID=2650926 RepID=UPI0025B93C48|nr:sugar-binding transcriptional regulator [Aestuariivirga sp.]MCA3561541.1 sugar-binding transcriptional regulator [Aestuariivirga sp.]